MIVDREIAENCLHSTNHHKVFKENPHPTNLLGVFFGSFIPTINPILFSQPHSNRYPIKSLQLIATFVPCTSLPVPPSLPHIPFALARVTHQRYCPVPQTTKTLLSIEPNRFGKANYALGGSEQCPVHSVHFDVEPCERRNMHIHFCTVSYGQCKVTGPMQNPNMSHHNQGSVLCCSLAGWCSARSCWW